MGGAEDLGQPVPDIVWCGVAGTNTELVQIVLSIDIWNNNWDKVDITLVTQTLTHKT